MNEVQNPIDVGHLFGDETTIQVTKALKGMFLKLLVILTTKSMREEIAKSITFPGWGKLQKGITTKEYRHFGWSNIRPSCTDFLKGKNSECEVILSNLASLPCQC